MCPIIYADTIYYAILYIETVTMYGTTKPNGQVSRPFLL